jgi:uncharacterized protein (DUF2267 family)
MAEQQQRAEQQRRADQEQRQAARFERRPDDGWRYERFLTTIREQTGLDRDHAERAAMATLETLAERLPKARAEELAEDLPERLRFWLQNAGDEPGAFGVLEFARRVAEREEVDGDAAGEHARAVFRALARVAPAYEIEDLAAALPPEYELLLGDATREVRARPDGEIHALDEFVERVKQRADLDWVDAERASEVVLELLAERLSAPAVAALQAAVPEQFNEAIARGDARAGHKPRELSLDEFVEGMAREERVSFDEAFRRACAVFRTLAEAIPPKQFCEILRELPRGYRETFF